MSKFKVFFTVHETYEQFALYKILPVSIIVYVWLIINLLPSKVSVFITSRATNSHNF